MTDFVSRDLRHCKDSVTESKTADNGLNMPGWRSQVRMQLRQQLLEMFSEPMMKFCAGERSLHLYDRTAHSGTIV